MYKAAVITVSDKGSRGLRKDTSGPYLEKMLTQEGYKIVFSKIVADEQEQISEILKELTDHYNVNLILTTGGTGISLRDVTPEATLAIAHKIIPGIAEYLRLNSYPHSIYAALSRGVAVTRNESLIINLPGSLKAVEENWAALQPVLAHAIGLLVGIDKECAREAKYESS